MTICPISTPRLNEARAGDQRASRQTEFLQGAREAEAVDHAEAKGVTPALVDIAGDEDRGGDVTDGSCNVA
jgi:hypothetical protein